MKEIKKDNLRKKRQREGGEILCYIDIYIKMETHTPALWEIETSQVVQKTLAHCGFPRVVFNTCI